MYQYYIYIKNNGRNSPSNRRIRWIMPAACYRGFDGSAILAELLSRMNYREILGSGSLSFKARLGIEREMMDQLFPRAPLSTYPFFPRSWDGRQTVGASGKGKRKRGRTKKGEKREKRKRNCRTTYYHEAHIVNGVATSITGSILWRWEDLTKTVERLLHINNFRFKDLYICVRIDFSKKI